MPVFMKIELGNAIANGVTFSGDVTACVTVFDVLVIKRHAPGL